MSNRLYGPNVATSALGTPPIPENAAINHLPVLPALQLITTTTETFVLNPASSTSSAPVALAVAIPSKSITEGKKFYLRGSGYLVAAGTYTALLRVYANPTANAGTGGTSLGNSGAITFGAAATQPFNFEFSFTWDGTSGRLIGSSKFNIANQLVAEAALSNALTGLSNSSNPVVTFVLGVTFGTAAASNAINVAEFAIYEA